MQKNTNDPNNLNKEEQSWKTSNLKTSYFKKLQSCYNQASVVLAQNKQQSTEQKFQKQNLLFLVNWIFDRNPKAFQWEQNSLFKMNGVGQLDIHICKRMTLGPTPAF